LPPELLNVLRFVLTANSRTASDSTVNVIGYWTRSYEKN